MFQFISKIFSALDYALSEPSEEKYTPRPEPGFLIIDKNRYPLTRMECVDGGEAEFTLDFGRREISGPVPYPFEAIDVVATAFLEVDGVKHEFVTLKIQLGPYLCLEPSENWNEARALGERIVERLGLQCGVCSTWPELILGPALDTIERGRIKGNFALDTARSTPEAIVVSIALSVENENRIDAWGNLVFGSEGIYLYNGIGQKRKVCDNSEVEDWTMEEGAVYLNDSDYETLELSFRTRGGIDMALSFRAQQIHDDPIAGEQKKSDAEMQAARNLGKRLRAQVLG